jgi:flagellar motor switch protein FliG
MKFQGGVKEAAKMLAGLSRSAREKILEIISKKDPRMAEVLHKSMYTLEDLKYLTPLMLSELLKEVKISDMGLAMRISSNELKDFMLKNSPRGIRQEMEEILTGPPQLASKVQEAEDRIMAIVIAKVDKGQLIINKESSEKLV